MAEDPNSDANWRTQGLRQNVRQKIEEAIRQSGNPTQKSVSEMENHIFHKAKSKEEYLSFTARLILHVKEMNSKKQPAMQQIGGQGMMPSDPMSALQSMAGQPQQPLEMPANNSMPITVQSLNDSQQQMQTQNMSQQQMQQQMQHQMQSNQQMNVNVNQAQQQLQMRAPNSMTLPAGNRSKMMMGQVMGMSSNGNVTNIRPQQVLNPTLQMQLQRIRQPGNMSNMQMQQQQQQQQQANFDNPQMVGNDNVVTMQQQQQQQFRPTGMTQNQQQIHQQIQQQQMNNMMNNNLQSNQNQINVNVQNQNTHQITGNAQMMNNMNPSVGYAPSPSNMMAPSPLSQPMHRTPQPPPSHLNVPSPCNTSINTPASVMIASPNQTNVNNVNNQNNEEQAYLDKLKHLSKYIEPLRATITRIDQDERFSVDRKRELSKMKNLLEILVDPNRRCPMATLEKCEQVLEKMDFKVKPQQPPIPPKVQDICQPLLDAVIANMKKPLFNHSLTRTFAPAISALINNNSRPPSPPVMSKHEELFDVPEVLQGEIARLDWRFKVQLDSLQNYGSKAIQLICRLDDKYLPCVPALSISVPESYPDKPPQCSIDPLEYSASPFFVDIRKAFEANLQKLSEYHSVTSLLNSWEMSVRQASTKSFA